jgi:hypothetical protein
MAPQETIGKIAMTGSRLRVSRTLPLLVAAALLLPGCQTIRELAALRSVDFDFGQVGDVRLAGIDVMNVRSIGDLGILDGARVAAAVAERRLPLTFTVGVLGTNPESNQTTARLIRLDWSLFLDETETVSGVLDGPIALPPGETVNIPVGVALDLFEFFDRSAGDMVKLAGGLTGVTDQATRIRIQATPTVDTPLGPIRYPEPVSIVNVRAGG